MQYYRINHSEPTKQEITHFSFSSTDGAPVLRIVFKTSGAKVESILTDNTEITSLEILNDDSVIYFNVDDLDKNEIAFISSLKITQIPTAVKKVNGSGVTLKIKSYEEYKSWAAC